MFACVLLPLWISVLVRTFSWMLLLERNGPVNRLLVGSGLVDQPLSLLFNHTGVLIGMVHVLLPYAVLPIYAALVRIDPALLRASEGLGASAAHDVPARAPAAVAARRGDGGDVHVPARARLFRHAGAAGRRRRASRCRC